MLRYIKKTRLKYVASKPSAWNGCNESAIHQVAVIVLLESSRRARHWLCGFLTSVLRERLQVF
jgi:hypothetical protein